MPSNAVCDGQNEMGNICNSKETAMLGRVEGEKMNLYTGSAAFSCQPWVTAPTVQLDFSLKCLLLECKMVTEQSYSLYCIW